MAKPNKKEEGNERLKTPTGDFVLDTISGHIIDYLGLKDEDDFMYKRGVAKAKERLLHELFQQQRFTAIGLLDSTNLKDAEIISIFNIPTPLLSIVKRDLAAAPTRIVRLRKTLSAEQIAEKLNLPVNWVQKQLL